MNIKQMKLVDETLGPLICFGLYWLNLLMKIFFKPKYEIEPQSAKNILLIKFFGMGSIILATPMMRALKERYPNAKITILTFLNNKDLCERIEFIDETLTVDTGSFLSFMVSLLKAISQIRKKRFEISIDLEFFAKSSTVIQYLCGTKIRVGFYLIQFGYLLKMMWRGNLLTHNVYYNSHKHTVEAFLALARSIGASTQNLELVKPVIHDKDRIDLHNLLTDVGTVDNYIVMNINSGLLCLERRWPIEHFAGLTKKIIDCMNVTIVLIGNRSDIEYVDKFIKMIPENKQLINLTGKLNIGMLAVLLSDAQLFITNDSGPLHIAVSLGVPTISFFGPETPVRFGPLGNNHTVFYCDIYCSPCLNINNQKTAPCNGNNECMIKISSEEVFRTIKERYLKKS